MQNDIWRLFWAKTDRSGENPAWTRPLWAHLLDVAHAALLMWDACVPRAFRQRVCGDLGLNAEDAGRLLSFWIGLHDIGKAIPMFQGLHPHSRDKLRQEGLSFDFHERRHHGHASIAILYNWLNRERHPDIDFLKYLGAFVGFHHGRLYREGDSMLGGGWAGDALNPNILGDEAWQSAQYALLDAILEVWFAFHPVTPKPSFPAGSLPNWMLGFAGWATLADWLGSMAECFDARVASAPAAYMPASLEGARRALQKSGLTQTAAVEALPFDWCFPGFTPNALQQCAIEAPLPENEEPTLTIIEAPTGEGKTEAALYLASRQQVRSAGGGLYIAMPTQATSNGLFDRTIAFLEKAHRGSPANFRLAHGNAELHEGQAALFEGLQALEAQYEEDGIDYEGRVRTLEWFRSRKRALLAPYGLGTVDQVLLCVLYARHFFLRLFALAGKTIIFDEVHAYDLYMLQLFHGLLLWMKEMGTHVIVLSATLPAAFRNAFIRAWGAEPDRDAPADVVYPAVWTVAGGLCTLTGGFATHWTQRCVLARRDPDPERLAASVIEAAIWGACTGVICNTVGRAQQVYEKICEAVRERAPDMEIVLFHARFRFCDRQEIEKKVSCLFGKGRQDSVPAVLVATQVAEQSLDLDFDVLFTDLAPIDLLLQRAGRLHRHTRRRPPGFETPALYWLCPEAESGSLPSLDELGIRASPFSVYDAFVVYKTWMAIVDRTSWELPADYRPLIETVYNDDKKFPEGFNDEARGEWNTSVKNHERDWVKAIQNAGLRMTPPPNDVWGFVDYGEKAIDDEERLVLTRDGSDSIEAIILFRDERRGLFLDPECTVAALIDIPEGRRDLPVDRVRALLQNGIRIGYEKIAREIRTQPVDPAWRAAAEYTASLAHSFPLVLDRSTAFIAGYRLRYDYLSGMHIQKL